MSENAWLQSLKAGDKVIVSSGYGFTDNRRIVEVSSTTPTQVVIGDSRYRKKDGYAIGGSYSYGKPRLLQATAGLIRDISDQQEKSTLVYEIETICSRSNLRHMNLGALRRIKAALPANPRK